MNINTLSNQETEYKSGNLPVALYPNKLRKAADGSDAYYARPISRGTCTLANLADDLVATGVVSDLPQSTILRVARAINTAKLNRLMDGFTVDDEVCRAAASVTGTFTSDSDTFSAEHHSIDLSVTATAKTKELLAQLQVAIRQGNTIRPHITAVRDLESQSGERLTRGGFLEVTGRNITIAGTSKDVGLYFECTTDVAKTVRLPAEKLGTNTQTRLACVVPASLEEGTYRLKVVTQFCRSKALRKEPQEYTFSTELTVA